MSAAPQRGKLDAVPSLNRHPLSQSRHSTLLVILDGFGHREASADNAVLAANTPHLNALFADSSHTLISGSGLDVGLPEGQMGNSEVGHMSLGAGRIVYQSITRIDESIASGDFVQNPAYLDAIDNAVNTGNAVHIMGLLSPGGVHSHEDHIFAALRLAAERGARQIYLHAFLDGRDTPPRSATHSLERAEAVLRDIDNGRIASVHGRYWAMDRDSRWDRIQPSYELIAQGAASAHAASALEALESAYARGEDDEFVPPTCIGEPVTLKAGDAMLFMNRCAAPSS